MVDASIQQAISECLGRLPIAQQRQVLDFARTLTTPLPGVRGSSLTQFAGKIDEPDLEKMSQAIDEACEGIDPDEW